jgi:hypothetical protein
MSIAHSATQVMDLSKLALKAKVPRSSAVRFVEILFIGGPQGLAKL